MYGSARVRTTCVYRGWGGGRFCAVLLVFNLLSKSTKKSTFGVEPLSFRTRSRFPISVASWTNNDKLYECLPPTAATQRPSFSLKITNNRCLYHAMHYSLLGFNPRTTLNLQVNYDTQPATGHLVVASNSPEHLGLLSRTDDFHQTCKPNTFELHNP